jgi:TP901 family phage tail tape measure protein
MAYDIGTARGVIEMEYNGRGVTQAQQDLQGLEKTGERSGVSMDSAAKNMGKAGLVIAAGLGAGVMAAANFEQRLSAIQAVSGATGDEMASISEKALQLGADTSFSAGEAAVAMEELVKAGLSVDEVLNGAADAAVALAAAGEISLPEAATIASNAMNQFGLAAKDLPGVADLIAGAANASSISVGDLGQSMKQVGAVANLAGLNFEDTATAIALMGNAGIVGSDAGTSLKSMLQRLQPTTAKQMDLFKQLGIITADGTNKFYDAEGSLKSFDKVSQVLSNSLTGMTDKQKQATLQTLFGADAIRAAAIMADNGAKGFNKMGDAMNKTTAADVAATRLDNFKGSIEAMMGSLETLGITLGTILLPPLRQIVEAITSALNWFTNLDSGVQKVIVGIAAFAAAGLLVGAAVLKIIIFISRFQAALTILRGTMIATWAAALGPIALVIAAIAAVVAIIILLWNKSETFKAAVLAVWGAIRAGAQAVASWFMGTFVPALQAAWQAIVGGVRAAFNLIVAIIRAQIMAWRMIIVAGLNAIKAVWGALWRAFGPLVRAAWAAITAIIRLHWVIIRGLVMAGVRAVSAAVRAGWNAIKAVTSAIWNGIKTVIMGVWNFIKPFVTTAANGVKTAVSNAWTEVKNLTTTMWNALKGIIEGAVNAFMTVVNGIKGKVLGAFAGAATWLYDAGKAVLQGLIDGASSMLGKLADIANKAADIVAKVLPGSPVREGPLKVLNRGHAGKEIVRMAIDGITSMQRPLEYAMNHTMTSPLDAVSNASPTGTIRSRGGDGSGGPMQVQGTLDIANGVAYISGIAMATMDGVNSDNGRRGRMNWNNG